MATQKNASQPQQSLETWNLFVDQHLSQLNASYKQMAEIQKMGLDHTRASMETNARFVKDSLDFAGKISAEWTERALETNRQTVEIFRGNTGA